jgi:ComF family protein
MLKTLIQATSQFIAPAYCAYCHAFLSDRAPLCQECLKGVLPIVSREISLSKTKLMRVYAISAYEDPLKSLILAKNYGSMLASKHLGMLITERIPLHRIACDMIVPIPLHWTRYAQRGFNQAEIIGDVVAKYLKKPTIPLIKRIRRTPLQVTLQATQRKDNVFNAFQVTHGCLITGKHIVLVDDLMTTGATLTSGAQALLPYNPASITAVVACRTL